MKKLLFLHRVWAEKKANLFPSRCEDNRIEVLRQLTYHILF